MDPTLLALRWAHILAAIVTVGGLVFARFALLPGLSELDEESRQRVHDRIRRHWLPWVTGGIALLLASGLSNFLLFNVRVGEEGWAGGAWMRATHYHAIFGVKFLLALIVFFFASGLVGRGSATQWLRANRSLWLTVTIGLAVVIVMISGWMRQLHTGPNEIVAGDGGVMIEETIELREQEPRREAGSDADGQEGQEADRGAPAQDSEAPATPVGGEETAG